ncbi:hypothetical protein SKAU_G00419900 [Synaphobranchus kaupii]|uniref:Uncharacterized protein n=1 Tax=Synaphobranchus kaupii TaxID=118154 RepID=A0A9Q1E6F1_SYNKA|nr:hypothetical protein SKAU_G00419900 [Synaphobranchus kaupii]
MRSTRLMQQLLEGIRAAFPASHSGALQKIFRLGKPGETGEEFPPVSVAAAYDDQRDLGNSLLNPETPQLGDFQGGPVAREVAGGPYKPPRSKHSIAQY